MVLAAEPRHSKTIKKKEKEKSGAFSGGEKSTRKGEEVQRTQGESKSHNSDLTAAIWHRLSSRGC